MKQKRIIRSLFLPALLLSTSVLAAEEVRIATVDVQQALQSVEAGKKAKAILEKEFNDKKKQLQSEESAIKKMTEEFKKQSMVMSDEARAKKQTELQERIMKFQQQTAMAQQNIQEQEGKLTAPILKRLGEAIAEVAKKKNYTLVLEKKQLDQQKDAFMPSVVLYSQPKDDITSEVISTFDKGSKDKS